MRPYTALACVFLSLHPSVGFASPQAVAAGQRTENLKVRALYGQDAVNNITQNRAVSPVVEVLDQNGLPVQGAEVEFVLPASEPGGHFANGAQKATVTTDSHGQAAAPPFSAAGLGTLTIEVTARAAGQSATIRIQQTNSNVASANEEPKRRKEGGHSYWKWIVLGGVAAAAAVTVVLLTGGNGDTITATPGPITVGGPR